MPRAYLDEIVRPNLEEFESEVSSIRRANNAISTLDALVAHLYRWCVLNNPSEVSGVRDDSHYREKLSERNYHFRLLRDIAKAQKHVHLERGKPEVSKADQITSKALGYGQGKYGAGRYGGVAQVVVDLDNGDLEYIETILRHSLSFLESEIARLGIA
jgi:hypothetical protein